MTRIYTRSGDQGQTGLANGTRTAKNSARIEALGSVDECNAHLGVFGRAARRRSPAARAHRASCSINYLISAPSSRASIQRPSVLLR